VTAPESGTADAAIRAEIFSEIGNLLDVGVLSVDTALVVTGWNTWLERITGRRECDAIGRSLREFEPALRPSALAALERAAKGSVVIMSQGLHEYLLEVPAPAGFERMKRMQQSVRILPQRGPDGSPLGATAFIEDVTERVAREADLRAAVDEAHAANEARSRFFAAMSHELRTPIGAISGYADLLVNGMFGPIGETQREPLGRIRTVASHLQHIVDEILSFSRIGAGREETQITDADAIVLAREALVAVEPLAVKKGLAVRSRFPADRIAARTDQVKVRQILINLLGNAIKFTERGSIELEVALTDEGRMVAFSVLDTGAGIAAADLVSIFEPFTRVPTRGASKPGTGLGLAVSRGLARLLGGDIAVTSEIGVGSRFTATIPR
jgi:signal transduction histidine kinase